MGGNPIWNKDPNGDDFVNASTADRKAAEAKKDEAQTNLNKAQEAAKPFEGITKKEAKAAGILDEFKAAHSNLKSAQKSFDSALQDYNQEVENEATVDAALALFKEINPEQYARFDKFNPNGKGVIDIFISGQKDDILIESGPAKGQRTTESITTTFNRIGGEKVIIGVQIRLQVVKYSGVVKIISITGTLVHALGHLQGDGSEDAARQFETEQFDNKIKNRKN